MSNGLVGWRPKDGDWVWVFWKTGVSCEQYYRQFDMAPLPTLIAAVENFDEEKTWTAEQFIQRGNTWEAL